MAQRNQGLMGQYAGFVTRAFAIIIDILIVIVSVIVITASISLPLDFFLGINAQSCAVLGAHPPSRFGLESLRGLLCSAANILSVAVAILTGPVYFIFLATAGGQTVGKYVMGVRVVRLDGKPMSYVGSTLRWFGYLVSLLPLGLGFAWVVIDDRRRGFHDRLAGTCVIYSWRAQQNEYLLARIQRLVGRASKRGRVALMRALATQPIELVTLAVPGFNELNDLLRIVKDGMQEGEFEVLAFQEYAKSSDGQLNLLDVDPTLSGVTSVVEFSEYAGLTPARIHEIRDELPNDHFALALLVNEQGADRLVKLVARRTSAQIRRYELREAQQTVPGSTRPVAAAPVAAAPVAAAPVAAAPVAAAPVAAAPTPASGALTPPAAQGRSAGTALPAPATSTIPAQVAVAAPGERSNGLSDDERLADALPTLVNAVNSLKEQQNALQAELAVRNAALARLELLIETNDARVTGASAPDTVTPAPVAPAPVAPATAATEIADWQHRYPALLQLGEDLAALPATKAAAINAAVAARTMPRLVAAPQDLTAIRGIGPVFEQRLYRHGVGTFWEVATLDDDTLGNLLQLTDLQRTQVAPAAIRAEARQLAAQYDAVGMLWQGLPPDDFEPIEGIGPVFEQRLYEAGIRTLAALANATPAQLATIIDPPQPLQPDYAGWIAQAQVLLNQKT